MIVRAQVRKQKLTTFRICKSLEVSKLSYYPIQIVFSIDGERFMYNSQFVTTNIKMECPTFDDPDKSKIENLENTLELSRLLETCKNYILDHPRMDMKELKRGLFNIVKGENCDCKDDTFATYIEQKVVPDKNTASTKEKYRTTIKHIRDFDESVTFETMDKGWLKMFEEYMRKQDKSPYTIHIQLRNIRAAWNQAISEEATECKNPFLIYKMPKAEKKKEENPMSAQDFADFRDYPCIKEHQKYKDFVLLSFYLGGINPRDLLSLKSLSNGRIITKRAKTGSNINLPISEEAQEIIDRHRGKKVFLDFTEHGTELEIRNFCSQCDKHLKRIGICHRGPTKDNPYAKNTYIGMMPRLTIYTFRRTFATIAAELDEPTENIALTLAHKQISPYTITEVYIVRSNKKIDHCISTVLEHLRTIKGRSKEVIDKEILDRA